MATAKVEIEAKLAALSAERNRPGTGEWLLGIRLAASGRAAGPAG